MSKLHDDLRDVVTIRNERTRAAALADLRVQYGAAAVAAALAAIQSSPPSETQISVSGDGNAQIKNNTIVTLGDGAIYNPDPAATAAEQALRGALQQLAGACSPLQLVALDESEARNPQAMRLAQVYVGLHVERTVAELDEDELAAIIAGLQTVEALQLATNRRLLLLHAARSGKSALITDNLHAIEALHLATNRHLLLLGAPGSGKSTFVNHLLLTLAEAQLAPDIPTRDAYLADLLLWQFGDLLPVRVILRDMAAFAFHQQQPLAQLHEFLEASLVPNHAALPLMLEALRAGRAILCFDGLDEVVGAATLSRVTTII